jgi:hypothetical protein
MDRTMRRGNDVSKTMPPTPLQSIRAELVIERQPAPFCRFFRRRRRIPSWRCHIDREADDIRQASNRDQSCADLARGCLQELRLWRGCETVVTVGYVKSGQCDISMMVSGAGA